MDDGLAGRDDLPPQALALYVEHQATQARLAAQRAQWDAHLAAMAGAGGDLLAPDAAIALLAAHRETVDLEAAQQALWRDHLDALSGPAPRTDPMDDARIAQYYASAARRKTSGNRADATRRQRERKAWELLRQKLTNQTRSEAMSTEEAGAAAPATQPALDWGTPPDNAAGLAAQEQANFAQARRAALADPARAGQTNAGRFALDQAQHDRMAPAPFAGALDGLTGTRAALGRLTPAAALENTIEPVLAAETGTAPQTAPPAQPAASPVKADAAAREQALDAAALEQLAVVRETERQEVARLRGWSENTIEPADVAVRAPAAAPAAAPVPVAPVANLEIVPPEVESAFLRVGSKFHMLKNPQRVAFEDHGVKLKTALNDSNVALAMVQIAQARGWTAIKVSGTPEFCRDAWQKAALRGMAVHGYEPNELDKADLARRLAARPAPNQVGQGMAAPVAAAAPAAVAVPAPAPVAANGQPGIYISADDAALLAVAKAALQQPAAAPVVAPAVAATPPAAPAPAGDTLVSHGPAPYQHDPESALSYVVRLRNAAGREREVWGVNLGRAIAESGVKVGDRISLVKNGKEQVEVDARVKNEAGQVVGVRKIGAVRNEWQVKAHALATQPPAQAVAAHPELAGMLAKLGALDKQAAADGLTPAQRAYVSARAQQHAAREVERGNVPVQRIRDNVVSKRQPQQEMAQ